LVIDYLKMAEPNHVTRLSRDRVNPTTLIPNERG